MPRLPEELRRREVCRRADLVLRADMAARRAVWVCFVGRGSFACMCEKKNWKGGELLRDTIGEAESASKIFLKDSTHRTARPTPRALVHSATQPRASLASEETRAGHKHPRSYRTTHARHRVYEKKTKNQQLKTTKDGRSHRRFIGPRGFDEPGRRGGRGGAAA